MKSILKGERNRILVLLLLGLLIILWGRIIAREIRLNTYFKGLFTLKERIECLNALGWDVDIGSETNEKIKIPEEFDDVYNEYNKLQRMCGFDLLRFSGKTVTKYTYYLLNPPYENGDPFYVNILVYDDELIGGDVMSRKIDGIMLPLFAKK